jgi:PAS domain S-box-containing protein
MHGFASPEELIDSRHDISQQVYVDPAQREEFKRRLEKDEVVRGFEHQVFRKDCSKIWISVNAHAVKDQDGSVKYYEGTVRDITERKRAEQRLGEYEKAVEGLDEMIVVVDRDYRYLLANRAFLKYRGLERDQLIGRQVNELLNAGVFENITRQKLDECFAGSVVKYESKYHYPTLGERHLFISYFPIESPHGIDRVVCVLKDITDSKQAEERLKASSEQLRALSARVQSAREEEGTRIAREIHDELGSALTSLRWGLDEISGTLSTELSRAGIEKVQDSMATLTMLVDTTFKTVRRISSELRPGILDEAGLEAAIACAAEQFETRSGISCRFQSSVADVDLSRDRSTAIFRILQEALTNIRRHAAATEVGITLKEETDQYTLTIVDNGRGITPGERAGTETLGLLGMRERAHLVGADFEIGGGAKVGTVVTVRVPMSPQKMKVRRAGGD